jgi:signal peptidase I
MIKLVHPVLLSIMTVLAMVRADSPLTMTVVRGHSMEPALHPGEFCVLDRGYYRSHALCRGDIVVLRLDGETYIKRIAALPGDRLWLLRYDDGTDDELLDAPQAARLRQLQGAGRLAGSRVHSLTLPTDYCFVLGDNRPVSEDSRFFGPVPASAIVGRAMR